MINLDIYSLRLGTYIGLTDTKKASSSIRPSISCAAYPSSSGHIELDTGQIFCSPDRRQLYKHSDFVDGQLTIEMAGEDLNSDISYFKGTIYVKIFISLSEIDYLLNNIRSGSFPKTARIHHRKDLFSSEGVWNNAKEQSSKIDWVMFDFEPLPIKRNSETFLEELPETGSYPELIRSEISSLRKIVDHHLTRVTVAMNYILYLTFALITAVVLQFWR